jgi:hypothetical protein
VWALVVVGLAGSARLAWWYWPGGVFSDTTSATWTALAWDLSHGELYRAVLAPSGYGGTRYMPLFFSVYSVLLRLHGDPVHAGVLLMQFSVLAAGAALYLAMRAADVPPRLALPFAGTMWATIVYQRYLTDVRADYLAAAFTVASVAAAIRASRRGERRWLLPASVCCVLGGLTKLTAIAVAVPIAFDLVQTGRARSAWRFLTGTAGAFVAIGLGVQLASHGRFLDNMRVAITAGMAFSDVWRHGVPSFFTEVLSDPFVAVPMAASLWCAWDAARMRRWSIVHTYLVGVLGLTVVILSSPGTASNQLVDLEVASTLVVASAVAHGQLQARLVAGGYGALAVLLAVASLPVPGLPSIGRTLRAEGPHQRSVVAAVHDELPGAPALYASTDPLVSILGGERPVILDAFSLNLFVKNRTGAGCDIERRIRARAFGAIVLRDDGVFPRDMDARDPAFAGLLAAYWARNTDLKHLVHETYEVRRVRRPFVIARPQPVARTGG